MIIVAIGVRNSTTYPMMINSAILVLLIVPVATAHTHVIIAIMVFSLMIILDALAACTVA
jgi:hypothetical protein